MFIDIHAHFTTVPQVLKEWRDKQIEEIEENGRHLSPEGLEITDDEIAAALSNNQILVQEEEGIDFTLLSPIAGKMAHHYGDQETSLTWSRLSNDVVCRASSLFPSRFANVCQLPQSPQGDIDVSVNELRRCVEELGFVGCNLNPDPSDGYWQAPPITDRYYYPLYEAMVDLDVPAMVHSSMSANPAVHGTCAHYLNGDTTAFMQLCQSDLFKDFPDLKLILPHGGGAVPYHWGRYRGAMQDQGRGELNEIIDNNIFFDTCVYHARGLELLLDVVPTSNILFASEMIGAVRGTDPDTGRRFDDTRFLLESLDGVTEQELKSVASENAFSVFPRLQKVLEKTRPGTITTSTL